MVKKFQLRLFQSSHHLQCNLCNLEFYSKYSFTVYCRVCRAIIDGKYYRVEKLKKLMKEKKPVIHPNLRNDRDRITLDIDDPKRDLEYALKTIKEYGFTEDIEERVSPGGHGRHVIGHTKEGSYPEYQLLYIRHLARDDDFRVMLDVPGKQRMSQVLFTKKREIPVPDNIKRLYREGLITEEMKK